MRLHITATAAAALGALGVITPAAGPALAAPGSSTCATQHRYERVMSGQTVAQVQREMGSRGAGRPGPGHGPGTRDLEKTWEDCSVGSVPVAGALQFGIDFQADAGHRLRVVGKSELPPTTVPGLAYVVHANG